MIPFPRPNYGIVKTETIFGSGRLNQNEFLDNNFTATKHFSVFNNEENKGRSLDELKYSQSSRANKRKPNSKSKQNSAPEDTLRTDTEQFDHKTKDKKCILKINEAQKEKKRKGKSSSKIKFILPLILGMLAAKSLLIPIAFKILALFSTKGLLVGLLATILASVIGVKGMFHPHNYWSRKDDWKPQEEANQLPYNRYEHYYDSDYYNRDDNVPAVPSMLFTPANEMDMNRRKKH